MPRKIALLNVLLMSLTLVCGGLRRAARPAAGPGSVSLPFAMTDNSGQQWMFYQGGWFQQQGNRSLFSQGAMLQINGNQPNQPNNAARRDDKTGEIVFDDLPIANVLLTRRILVDPEQGVARYIDVLRNPQAQDAKLSVQLQTNLNYGVNTAELVEDPKRSGQQVGWVALTGAGQSVVEMFAGKKSKLAPRLNWPQGNSYVQATLELTIPAGKEVALMHLHGATAGQQTGIEFLQSLDENKLMLSIPLPLRKLIVNFPQPQNLVGDLEVLRGDVLDVIELRGGDQLRGTIDNDEGYKLATSYGTIQLHVDRVVGLINVGEFRPRQLLVTADGEVYGGSLEQQTIGITLSSGQNIAVPLRQISRMGYRKRAGEPEEWTFAKPYVSMRAGDRVGIELPAQPIEFFTRYGKLAVPPAMIHAIVLQTEDQGVHELQLIDGSHVAGLLAAEQVEVVLAGTNPPQTISFPASSAVRMQFTAAPEEPTDATPSIELTCGDLLVGALTGPLRLDTAFDTVAVNAAEIASLTQKSESQNADVQMTLWDKTMLSGQLEEPAVECRTASGLSIALPVALIGQYTQPLPQPSAGMIERIRQIVAELNADDWKQRDQAEAQLVSLGTTVIGVLNDLRSGQPPEAQKRIDSILRKLEAPGSSAATTAAEP